MQAGISSKSGRPIRERDRDRLTAGRCGRKRNAGGTVRENVVRLTAGQAGNVAIATVVNHFLSGDKAGIVAEGEGVIAYARDGAVVGFGGVIRGISRQLLGREGRSIARVIGGQDALEGHRFVFRNAACGGDRDQVGDLKLRSPGEAASARKRDPDRRSALSRRERHAGGTVGKNVVGLSVGQAGYVAAATDICDLLSRSQPRVARECQGIAAPVHARHGVVDACVHVGRCGVEQQSVRRCPCAAAVEHVGHRGRGRRGSLQRDNGSSRGVGRQFNVRAVNHLHIVGLARSQSADHVAAVLLIAIGPEGLIIARYRSLVGGNGRILARNGPFSGGIHVAVHLEQFGRCARILLDVGIDIDHRARAQIQAHVATVRDHAVDIEVSSRLTGVDVSGRSGVEAVLPGRVGRAGAGARAGVAHGSAVVGAGAALRNGLNAVGLDVESLISRA